jgi:hypothetical protein
MLQKCGVADDGRQSDYGRFAPGFQTVKSIADADRRNRIKISMA